LRTPVADPVSSPYGQRVDPKNPGTQQFHEGVDFSSGTGTIVHAVADGIVARAYDSRSFGKTLIIEHGTTPQGDSVFTLSAHNSVLLVNAGDSVFQGQSVALSGSTGRSTGPHVHFEVRLVPIGGPSANELAFFDENLSTDPMTFDWSQVTP
jgi:murein DD-endopeptidase MepM/ murein hydrolase activator NlpD